MGKLKVRNNETAFKFVTKHLLKLRPSYLQYDHKVILSPKCPAYKNSVFKKASDSCLKKADEAEEALHASQYIAQE